MRHLDAREFVDLVEGRLDDRRADHTRTCASCARQAADVRDAMTAMNGCDVPEPGPVFWDAFSARVRGALDEIGEPRQVWWRRPAVALACAVVVLASFLLVRGGAGRLAPPPDVSARAGEAPSSASSRPALVAAADPTDDAAWQFLADAASSVGDDGSEGGVLTVSPQAVDQAVLELTPAERDELGRLLERELHRTGA